ncbi:MAG TPA: GH1 family beta-glucosidase [Polyangiaceae bacterium]|nr:GH1 family beta-glucosidase [Polyangiaceae bacterium]
MAQFPEKFVFGAAAASYQIEGAVNVDGRGASVWDMFCRKPDAVWNGHTGDVACDHYHRYAEDVGLMKELNLQAYRLSVAWPRIQPTGVGKPNAAGLDFYDRLVDALLKAGITPWVTLFHWDFPLDLYHRGGWLNRDSADWFGDYTSHVVARLSDRVTHWMTLNEPQVYIGAGHHEGRHAPGDRLAFKEVLLAGHHTLLAHGKAVQAIRAGSKQPCRVGYAPVALSKMPFDPSSAAHVAAAREHMFSIGAETAWTNTWWMDPVFLGKYPEDGLALFGKNAPTPHAGDLELMKQPLDFCGVNIYQGQFVRPGKSGKPEEVPAAIGARLSAFEWSITPEAMYWGPKFLYERYGQPIVVTENGISCRDWVSLDGEVHDPQRVDFTHRYLLEGARAIADGVPIEAYFHWSFIDNFEWGHGYKHRFGMTFCDYENGGRRTIKDSGRWYAEVIRTRGASLG